MQPTVFNAMREMRADDGRRLQQLVSLVAVMFRLLSCVFRSVAFNSSRPVSVRSTTYCNSSVVAAAAAAAWMPIGCSSGDARQLHAACLLCRRDKPEPGHDSAALGLTGWVSHTL